MTAQTGGHRRHSVTRPSKKFFSLPRSIVSLSWMSDASEIENGTDPNVFDVDPDGDGLDIAAEGEFGTNPFLADTDDHGTNDADDTAPTDPNTA